MTSIASYTSANLATYQIVDFGVRIININASSIQASSEAKIYIGIYKMPGSTEDERKKLNKN